MPQAIIGVIGWATGAAVSTAVTVVVYAVSILGTIALSSSQKRKAERMARAQTESAIVDRLVNTQNTIGPRELVLGRVRKGGTVFFQTAVAPHNAVFLTLTTLAGHEIDGVERVYFNDTPIDLDVDGNVVTAPWGRTYTRSVMDTSANPTRTLDHTPVAGSIFVTPATNLPFPNITPGQESLPYTIAGNVLTITGADGQQAYTLTYQWVEFISTARVFWHLGSPDQAADTRLQSYLPGTWTAAHRVRGVAYMLCEFVYEESSFPGGLPNITAQIRGAKLYDPRNGITSFSENPALMARYVLLHPHFGKRTSISASEEADIIAAANANDTAISYWTGAPVTPMFRANGVFLYGTPPKDVLDDLTQAMGGEWAYSGGEFSVRAGVYQAPVMALTEADLAIEQREKDGSVTQVPITLSPHKPRVDKINIVAPRIWDEAQGYVEVAIAPYRAEAYISDDGAELPQDLPLASVFNAGQATHIAGIMLRDGRDPLTVTLPFKMKAYPLEIFDGVTLTYPKYGWFAKEFRILARTFHPAPTGCYVELTLKETTAAIFQYGAGFLPSGYASNSGLPKPWEISPPTISDVQSSEGELIVQTDGTIVNSVRVTWPALSSASIVNGGSIEVQYLVLPNGDWVTVTVPGDATEARILGLDDLAQILVRARSRNSLAVSDWSPQRVHRVVGKTEPPPSIENFNISGAVLSWNMPRRVPDLAGFVFRFHYGNNTDWNSAAPLHNEGLILASPWEPETRPGGVVTIMGKAEDTSGNQSLEAAVVVMNLGDPPVANVLETWDFNALGWPYDPAESSGWAIVFGDPSANALDSFYGTDDQSFYTGDTESFYDPSAYGQMVYVTPAISVNSALAGSIMTLVAQSQGVDLRIDYRLAGPGSFYGPDAESFYGPDADPRYGPAGAWQPWPGQLVAKNDAYQFRVTIGAGIDRGVLQSLVLTIDAPDMEETIANLAIAAAGTVIPYTKPFTSIKTVIGQLQVNASGARGLHTDKTLPLSPKIFALNAAGTAVAGATADITLKGY